VNHQPGGRIGFKRWLVAALLLAPIMVGTLSATTAANTVPNTRLGETTQVTGTTELRPYVCFLVVTTNLVTGTGNTLIGTNKSDLILSGSGTRTISGKQGNDCVVGGASVRNIQGGAGYDVCIGPQSASFEDCESIVRR